MTGAMESEKLFTAIQFLQDAPVLIVGDIMLDAYFTGDAERISPEAPVPVVRIDQEKHLVGGAGNVARNITALGGKAFLVGVRGQDKAGLDLEQKLRQDNVRYFLHTLSQRPTTLKTRILAQGQQVLRFDREDASPLSQDETRAVLALVAENLPHCKAIVISDYGKGLVSPFFMRELQRLIEADGRALPLLVDPKPQNFSMYKGVSLLTPNAKEASESIHLPVKTPEDILKAGLEILEELRSPHLVVTLGGRGMAVFLDRRTVWHIPTTARKVFDVTGAGDTVIATLALGLAAGLPLLQACLLANYAAGVVVGEVGAATATPMQLTEAVKLLPRPVPARWL